LQRLVHLTRPWEEVEHLERWGDAVADLKARGAALTRDPRVTFKPRALEPVVPQRPGVLRTSDDKTRVMNASGGSAEDSSENKPVPEGTCRAWLQLSSCPKGTMKNTATLDVIVRETEFAEACCARKDGMSVKSSSTGVVANVKNKNSGGHSSSDAHAEKMSDMRRTVSDVTQTALDDPTHQARNDRVLQTQRMVSGPAAENMQVVDVVTPDPTSPRSRIQAVSAAIDGVAEKPDVIVVVDNTTQPGRLGASCSKKPTARVVSVVKNEQLSIQNSSALSRLELRAEGAKKVRLVASENKSFCPQSQQVGGYVQTSAECHAEVERSDKCLVKDAFTTGFGRKRGLCLCDRVESCALVDKAETQRFAADRTDDSDVPSALLNYKQSGTEDDQSVRDDALRSAVNAEDVAAIAKLREQEQADKSRGKAGGTTPGVPPSGEKLPEDQTNKEFMNNAIKRELNFQKQLKAPGNNRQNGDEAQRSSDKSARGSSVKNTDATGAGMCPSGFAQRQGDTPDDDAFVYETAPTIQRCAAQCRDKQCASFKHSVSERLCFLFKEAEPKKSKPFVDYTFCVRTGDPEEKPKPSENSAAGHKDDGKGSRTAEDMMAELQRAQQRELANMKRTFQAEVANLKDELEDERVARRREKIAALHAAAAKRHAAEEKQRKEEAAEKKTREDERAAKKEAERVASIAKKQEEEERAATVAQKKKDEESEPSAPKREKEPAAKQKAPRKEEEGAEKKKNPEPDDKGKEPEAAAPKEEAALKEEAAPKPESAPQPDGQQQQQQPAAKPQKGLKEKCEALANTCSMFSECLPGEIVNEGVPCPPIGGCDARTCCRPRLCDAFAGCPAGTEVQSAVQCAPTGCDQARCCQTRLCRAFQGCWVGERQKAATPCPLSGGCDRPTCCTPEKCGTFEKQCPAGTYVKEKQKSCHASGCHRSTCCVARPCGTRPDLCLPGQSVLEKVPCLASGCAAGTCCIQKMCQHFKGCPAGKRALEVPCPPAGCRAEVCCGFQGCASYKGCQLGEYVMQNADCKGDSCNRETCCHPKQCSSKRDVCKSLGQQIEHDKVCAPGGCDADQCCITRQCADFDGCQLGEENRRSLCSPSGCDRGTCCSPQLCTDFVGCQAGQALNRNSVCTPGVGCNDSTCCRPKLCQTFPGCAQGEVLKKAVQCPVAGCNRATCCDGQKYSGASSAPAGGGETAPPQASTASGPPKPAEVGTGPAEQRSSETETGPKAESFKKVMERAMQNKEKNEKNEKISERKTASQDEGDAQKRIGSPKEGDIAEKKSDSPEKKGNSSGRENASAEKKSELAEKKSELAEKKAGKTRNKKGPAAPGETARTQKSEIKPKKVDTSIALGQTFFPKSSSSFLEVERRDSVVAPVVSAVDGLSHAESMRKCAESGRQLCTFSQVCPKGEHEAPVDGPDARPNLWAAIKGENEWVRVGTAADADLEREGHDKFCAPHTKFHGKPEWGLAKNDRNLKLYCCARDATTEEAKDAAAVKTHPDQDVGNSEGPDSIPEGDNAEDPPPSNNNEQPKAVATKPTAAPATATTTVAPAVVEKPALATFDYGEGAKPMDLPLKTDTRPFTNRNFKITKLDAKTLVPPLFARKAPAGYGTRPSGGEGADGTSSHVDALWRVKCAQPCAVYVTTEPEGSRNGGLLRQLVSEQKFAKMEGSPVHLEGWAADALVTYRKTLTEKTELSLQPSKTFAGVLFVGSLSKEPKKEAPTKASSDKLPGEDLNLKIPDLLTDDPTSTPSTSSLFGDSDKPKDVFAASRTAEEVVRAGEQELLARRKMSKIKKQLARIKLNRAQQQRDQGGVDPALMQQAASATQEVARAMRAEVKTSKALEKAKEQAATLKQGEADELKKGAIEAAAAFVKVSDASKGLPPLSPMGSAAGQANKQMAARDAQVRQLAASGGALPNAAQTEEEKAQALWKSLSEKETTPSAE